jgi:hypothetical protein
MTYTTTSPASGNLERLAYTKAELCKLLHISTVTLWRLEKRGLLVPIPSIRHKIYSKVAVEAFLSGKSG